MTASNTSSTTAESKIWVGYFDEGGYGNYGWGGRNAETIGACGLVRFNDQLQPEWRFPIGEFGPIDDCYALNVADKYVWATYYSAFHVVRIDAAGAVRSWAGARTAAHALIVDGIRCALVSGYAGHRQRVLIGDLDQGHFKPYRLTLPGGRQLPKAVRIRGVVPTFTSRRHHLVPPQPRRPAIALGAAPWVDYALPRSPTRSSR